MDAAVTPTEHDGQMDRHLDRQRDRLALVLNQLEALPTLSPVAARLLSLGTGDDVQIDEIVSLIEADPTLTTRILGLCRRAGVGMSEQITTVRHAAVMLGLDAVRSAVLSVSVYELLEGEGERADERACEAAARLGSNTLSIADFDREGFWRYSIGVATGAEMLTARQRGLTFRPEEAFVAGLLADIGKLLLDYALPKAFARVIEAAGRRGVTLAQACRELIGVDHYRAGEHVASRWGLPGVLVGVIGGHCPSDPQSLPDGVSRELLGVVRTAIALCHELHIGFSAEIAIGQDPERIALAHGLSVEAVVQVREHLHSSVSQRCALMGLDEQPGNAMLMRSISHANQHLAMLNDSLRDRATQARSLADTLATVEWFLRSVRKSDPQRLGAAIAVSASRVIGGDRWALVRHDGQSWNFAEHDAIGSLLETHPLNGTTIETALQEIEQNWPASIILTGSDGEALGAVCGQQQITTKQRRGLGALNEAWTSGLERLTLHSMPSAPAEPSEPSANDDSALLDGAINAVDAAIDALRKHGGALQGQMKDKQCLPAVRGVFEATDALQSIIDGLASVRRAESTQSGTYNLREIADAAIKAARTRTGWSGEIDAEGVDPEFVATIDRSIVEQSLTELIVNAMEASTDSDVLIAAHRAGSSSRWEMRVTDRGCGPAPGTEDRLFEAFFTAKPPERHAGMGLTRARAMMRAHGGDAKLERTEDGRTRAMLLFEELAGAAGERGAAA